jgi:Mg-chelatase subunit ChlD
MDSWTYCSGETEIPKLMNKGTTAPAAAVATRTTAPPWIVGSAIYLVAALRLSQDDDLGAYLLIGVPRAVDWLPLARTSRAIGEEAHAMKRITATRFITGVGTSLHLGLCLLACGSTDTNGDGAQTASGGNSNPIINVPHTDSVGADGSASGGTGATGPTPTTDANCGMQTSETTKQATDVLLVLDRSGSMNESIAADCCCVDSCRQITNTPMCSDTANCAERWPALTSAVGTTLSSAAGITWGLKLFSSPEGQTACSVSSGVEVAIGAPNAVSAIQAQIEGVSPKNNTPTSAAITAATAYLKSVTDQNNRVILLATDGQPNCKSGSRDTTSDEQGTIAAIQAASAAGFRVYVIGIGPSVGNLDNFAQAGGTGQYYAATSAEELANALVSISKTVASCSFAMSQSPPDSNNVAVYLDGKLLNMDPSNGWSFGANSKTVILNGTSCESVQSGEASKVQVLFGCPGQTIPPNIY